MFYDFRQYHSPREINVHEHRASTDQSVKLLKEMEEKALDKIVESFVLKDNTLQTEIAVFISADTFGKNLQYCFNLNGVKMKGKFVVDYTWDTTMMINKVYEEMSKSIASVMFDNMDKHTVGVLFRK